MPDPTADDVLKEAYAMAPKGEVIYHTLEVRHPLFVDDDGNPDSAWVVINDVAVAATIEADAPVRGGENVTFQPMQFEMKLAPIELTPSPEIELVLSAVTWEIVQNLDRAVVDINKIEVCYRQFVASDLSTPRMLPPPTYDLSQAIAAGGTQMKGRARNGIDLRGNFPRTLYTAQAFPGLAGR
jgi:hypothetical protein